MSNQTYWDNEQVVRNVALRLYLAWMKEKGFECQTKPKPKLKKRSLRN